MFEGERIACVDYLEKWNLKSDNIDFTGCAIIESPPAILIQASYSVKGVYAKEAETMLNERFKMARLRFVCCGWESRPATYRDEEGETYDINMYSDAEFELKWLEGGWEGIDKFRISVGRYLVLP